MIFRFCPDCGKQSAILLDQWGGFGPPPPPHDRPRTPCRCPCGGWLGYADELPDQREPVDAAPAA